MAIKDKTRVDDHYSRLARKEGYPARSVYKLAEFDKKYNLIKSKMKVLDLGCAPGGWLLYASEKVGSKGFVYGIDCQILPDLNLPPNATFANFDLLECEPDDLLEHGPFNLVLSDMAPKTTGRKEVDQARSLILCQCALKWALELLIERGAFLFKIFQSPEGDRFIKESVAPVFSSFTLLKPPATRKQSIEIFGLGQGFLGKFL